MSTILILTLAGGCMTLLYLVYRYTIGGTLMARRVWLTVTALFYLVPLGNLKVLYIDILHMFGSDEYLQGFYYSNLRNFMEVHTEEMVYQNETFRLDTLIYIVWMTVAVGILLYNLIRHFVNKHWLVSESTEASPEQMEALERLKSSMGIHRKVRILFCGDISPVTSGFFRPVIFLPEKMREDIPETILKHELTHTKNGDVLTKMVLMLIVIIHWFNPLAYLLIQEYEKIYEMMCDDNALDGCDYGMRLAYVNMLLQESKAIYMRRGIFMHHLSREGKYLKERIENVMDKKNSGRVRKCVGSVALVAALFASSLTALAYEDVYGVDVENPSINEQMNEGNMEVSFSFEDELSFASEGTEAVIDTILYDVQFVDEDGNIYEVNLDGVPYLECTHNFKSGTCSIHTKYDDGSCIVTYYKGQACTKCAYMILEEFISSHTYATCPH